MIQQLKGEYYIKMATKTYEFGYKEVSYMWEAYKVTNIFSVTEFYSAFLRNCGRNYFFIGESHDFWEMLYVVGGNVVVTADERVISLSKNQLIFHQPGEFHTVRTSEKNGATIFVMSFSADGDFMQKFAKKILLLKPEETKELLGVLGFLQNINGDKEGTAPFIPYLDKVFEDERLVLKFKNLLEIFLINISEVASAENLIKTNETEIYRYAVNLIDKSLGENITVAEIAKRCSVSEAYLKKIFKKYAGIGVHSCVLNAKISLAKQMLNSGSSVTEISQKLAFSNANYFSIVFKRETGLSPREYKKR